MVVPIEVDHGLLAEHERHQVGINPSIGDLSALLQMKNEIHDEKEETRNRLAELSVFALSGFGFFETKLGTGTYNSE